MFLEYVCKSMGFKLRSHDSEEAVNSAEACNVDTDYMEKLADIVQCGEVKKKRLRRPAQYEKPLKQAAATAGSTARHKSTEELRLSIEQVTKSTSSRS